jgi:hypothetical protein
VIASFRVALRTSAALKYLSGRLGVLVPENQSGSRN